MTNPNRTETVREVLLAIGWELGTEYAGGWRTRCPIHQGANRSAFSYRDSGWTCFAGCGGGGPSALRRALGVSPLPPPRRHIVGMEFEPVHTLKKPSVSQRLEAEFRQQVRLRRQEAEEKHAWCIRLLCKVDDKLADLALAYPEPDTFFPPEAEEKWITLGGAWLEAMQQLRNAHAELIVLAWASRLERDLIFEPCFGGCYDCTDATRITPDTFAEIQDWLRYQDTAFQVMVQKFLEG